MTRASQSRTAKKAVSLFCSFFLLRGGPLLAADSAPVVTQPSSTATPAPASNPDDTLSPIKHESRFPKRLHELLTDQATALLAAFLAEHPKEKKEYDTDEAAGKTKEASNRLLGKWNLKLLGEAEQYLSQANFYKTLDRKEKAPTTWMRLANVERAYLEKHPVIAKSIDKIHAAMKSADEKAAQGDPKPGDQLISDIRANLAADIQKYVDADGKNVDDQSLVKWAAALPATADISASAPKPKAPGHLKEAMSLLFKDDPTERALAGFLMSPQASAKGPILKESDVLAAAAKDPAGQNAFVDSVVRPEIKSVLDQTLKGVKEFSPGWLKNSNGPLDGFLQNSSGNFTNPERVILESDILQKYYCVKYPPNAGTLQTSQQTAPSQATGPQHDHNIGQNGNLVVTKYTDAASGAAQAPDTQGPDGDISVSGENFFDGAQKLTQACKNPAESKAPPAPPPAGPAGPVSGQHSNEQSNADVPTPPTVQPKPGPGDTGTPGKDEGPGQNDKSNSFNSADMYRIMTGAALGATIFGMFALAAGGPFGLALLVGALVVGAALYLNLHPFGGDKK